MIRVKIFIFLYIISITFSSAQSYDRDKYYVIDFFSFDYYHWNNLHEGNLFKKKIDPKEITSLEFTMMGYYSGDFNFFKKFKNLENILIIGNDYDDSLKFIPKELLKIKSLKRVFIDRLAFELDIKHQIEKERPDVKVFWYDSQIYNNVKIIYHYPISTDYTIIYPKKVDYPGNFRIDSLIKLNNKSTLDLLEISQAYTEVGCKNNFMKEYIKYQILDSLYKILKWEAYNYTYSTVIDSQINNSLIDTAKVSYYFHEALKKDPNCGEVILYGIYYSINVKKDSLVACDYYHKLVFESDSIHFYDTYPDFDYYPYYLRLGENFPLEGECQKINPNKWIRKRDD